MIKKKADLRTYISLDMKANGIDRRTLRGKVAYWFNPRIRFLVCLRKYEYYNNIGSPFKWFWYWRFKRLSYKLNYTIYKNTFGPGLFIGHYGTVVVNSKARIGSNCRIHVCTNIGGSKEGVPRIGDNAYIGPGAKIFGAITIGNNVSIGANAVVNKSFPDDVVIAGVPAKIVKYKKPDM